MATTPANRISLYGLKGRFVASLAGIRDALAGRSIRPDTVSLFAIPIVLAIGTAIVGGRLVPLVWLLVPFLCFAWMAVNAIDGDLARATGATSTRGSALNELIDRLGDVVLLLAGLVVAPAWLIAGAALTVLSAEIVSLVFWAVVGERVFHGPMGKPDRALMISIGAVAAIVFPAAFAASYGVIAVGAGLAVIIRLRHLFAASGAGAGRAA